MSVDSAAQDAMTNICRVGTWWNFDDTRIQDEKW